MELPLVVGVDGSEPSRQAVDWAVAEAARHQLPLRLVYASLWERYEGAGPAADEEPPERAVAEHILGTATERARRGDPDVKVSAEVVPDGAVPALLRESRHAFAVVTGSRGRGELAGLLLGSVSLGVAGRAHCPVIVVRGDKAGLAGTHERIVLGAGDPSSGGEEAVRFAFREADVRGCTLDAVRAWRRPVRDIVPHPLLTGSPEHQHHQRASEELDAALHDAATGHPSVRLRRVTVEGSAGKVLLARSAAADLLIIGARLRHGHAGHHLGRVAHTLLHQADCPVAVVPQRA
ncbi:universal stress protein [Streptomyces viridochromogenes]|uniref:Putative Stress-inducible protein n=1 Tax=Streptomyces viridochromogenes Tue57 TaxID=1160705 RepID=L8P5U2_STRVR|nr:universal stress protein [Streptomyces viridochromogenes]ELS50647.1 putative Stress-inducible protein [Streptomyces viridochromogenes Tue57]